MRPSCSIVEVLPWTGCVADHLAAPRLDQRLMAETDAERRDPGYRKAPDGLEADSGLVQACTVRATRSHGRSRATADPRRSRGRSGRPRSRGRASQLAQVLDEVVRKAVVVINYQDSHSRDGSERSCNDRAASRAALRMIRRKRLTPNSVGRWLSRSPPQPRVTWRPIPRTRILAWRRRPCRRLPGCERRRP